MSKDSAIVIYGPNERPVTDALEGRDPKLQDGRLMEDHRSPMEKMQLLPVEAQEAVLTEYDRRRDHFFRWLLGKMQEGVHYGTPPGCEPSAKIDPRQWTAKPTLYKSGAKLLCDVLQLHDSYSFDRELWETLGEPRGTVCYLCTLKPRGSHRKVAIGRGTVEANEKRHGVNARVKIAMKRALVDAVIHAVPVVADLFTQDLEREDGKGDAFEPKAPEPPPRQAVPLATEAQRNELLSISTHEWASEQLQNYCSHAAGDKNLTARKASTIIERAKDAIAEAKSTEPPESDEPDPLPDEKL
jgi:hypothetical protein